MNKTNGCFAISWDFTHGGDEDLMLIAERKDGKLNIVNAFRGQEAHDIYEKLSTTKEENKHE